jgi:HK97 family phage portal protein
MGILDWLLGADAAPPDPVARELAPPYPSVGAQIRAYVAARELGGDLVLPAVERGVELLASAVAQLQLVAYRDGLPLAEQPRIVVRPDPWATSYAFMHQLTRSMVETGDGFAFLFDRDPETDRPRAAHVIPSDEVSSEWDAARFLPVHTWRGREMRLGVDLLHVPLAPRAGELRGRSPLVACRRALLAIEAAELYASGWFAAGGVPSGVLTSPATLDDGEADALLEAWLNAHGGPIPTPAVLSGGATYQATGTDPERSQLTESREHGVATVARLLGIPAPLLLVSLQGSTLTYQNVTAVYGELIRATVAPLYLAPIEAAFSDLVPRNSSVRFSLGELQRLDYTARLQAYQLAQAIGILDADAIRRLEGMPPETDTHPTPFAPTPAPATVPVPEVPA